MGIQETKTKYLINKLKEAEQHEQQKSEAVRAIIVDYIGESNAEEIEKLEIGSGDGFGEPVLVNITIRNHKPISVRFCRDLHRKDNPWKVTRVFVNCILRKRYFDNFMEALIFAGK